MNIFQAIYDFIQSVRDALLDLIQPLVMPDWGWLMTTVLPLAFVALVLLYFGYLGVLYRMNASANIDRRRARLQGRLAPPPGVHASPPSWWPVELSVGFFLVLLGNVGGAGVLFWLGVVVLLLGGWGWLRSANREWRRTEVGHGAEATPPALAAGPLAQAAIAAPGLAQLSGPVPVSRAVVPLGSVLPAAVPGAGIAPYEHAEPPPGVHMPAPSWWPVYASLAAFFALLGLVVNGVLLVTGIVLAILSVIGWYVDSYRELKVAEGISPRPHVRDPLAAFPRILATVGTVAVLLGVALAAGPGIVSGILPAQAGASASAAQCAPTPHPEITASGTKFSTGELCLPANTPFQLLFHNQDQVQHNLAIGTLFSGEVFSGPGDRTYEVPALPAGQYKFICVVHPTVMTGTAIVVAAGEAAPGGGPQPSP